MEGISYLPWISGAAQPKLTQERLMGIPIAVPIPEEQNSIASAVDKATRNFTNAIVCSRQEAELLHEYRQRLISDVVTGKCDVRDAAAALSKAEPVEAEGTLDAGLVTDAMADLDKVD